jgi:hypothetical protein
MPKTVNNENSYQVSLGVELMCIISSSSFKYGTVIHVVVILLPVNLKCETYS